MTEQPIILVVYLKRQAFGTDTNTKEMIRTYMNSINEYMEKKFTNSAVFFLPTDNDERIECINPLYIEDKNEIDKLRKTLIKAQELLGLDDK